MKKLENDIKKIIILSHYDIELKGIWGETAEEIAKFEKRAIDRYLGKGVTNTLPTTVISNVFHVRVDRDVALIMMAIEEYKNRLKREGANE